MAVYTGASDGAAKRLRPGTKAFIDRVIYMSGRALWNNGDFAVRNMRGKDSLSVHATGRAVDLSYRKVGQLGVADGRREAVKWCSLLAKNAETLGVEMVIDYFPAPYGRAWRCDRGTWQKYVKPTVSGAPGGDWLHVELTPAMADNAAAVDRAFRSVFGVV